MKKKVAILCDFDGTISTKDVGDTIVTTFSNADWEEAEEKFRKNIIGSKELYSVLYGNFDTPYEIIHNLLIEEIGLDPYFKQLLQYAQDNQMSFAVVSDGFKYYIDVLFEKFGIKDVPVYSNRMKFEEQGVSMEFPNSGGCGKCGNCKTSIFEKYKANHDLVVFVGDGYTDRCVGQRADILFAKDNLEKLCKENGWSYYPYNTFHDIITTLDSILGGSR